MIEMRYVNYMLGFRRVKSAGVRVTTAVHAAIRRGNNARDRSDWANAAAAYRDALASHPTLHHIWIQLGHALKESAEIEHAEVAYERARSLKPDDWEARMLLAHLHKNAARPLPAARYLVGLIAAGGGVDEACRELAKIVEPVALFSVEQLRAIVNEDASMPTTDLSRAAAALDEILQYAQREQGNHHSLDAIGAARDLIARIACDTKLDSPGLSQSVDRHLVFDISDLIAHFRNHRLPTGIQRVQIEVLAAALKKYGLNRVGICCFVDGRDYWIEVPAQRFLKLAYLSSSGGEADWQIARGSLFLHLAIDEPYDLPEQAVLVNLGTSWWIYDYFRLIREAKDSKGIAYIPLVFDLIPIIAPQYCVSGITGDYASWVVGVFQHADGYLAISESTKRDLISVAEQLGHHLNPNRVEVIPLDADFRRMTAASLPVTTLRKWQLEGASFALFVSTIEARKNHCLAFDAWAELLRRHGRTNVPRLVCVGRSGWLNDQAFDRLANNSELRAHVTIINHASDEELALLYRCSSFTVYPSHYEGWGLPVTESLSYGRIPIVADNSSLPEAGGEFALMFESNSQIAFVEAIERLTFDKTWKVARERLIELSFKPRLWSEIFVQLNDAVLRLTSEQSPFIEEMRSIELGWYYPTTLYRDLRIWRSLASGEIFRAGPGWLWPEPDGCRTTIGGGELRMTGRFETLPLMLYLHVRGLAKAACRFSLTMAGECFFEGVLRPGETRWVMAELPANNGTNINVVVRGELEEVIQMSTGGTVKQLKASISVLGFAVCARDDEDMRTRLVEAVGLGDIKDVSAYRKPDVTAIW